jgi:hypothetical protein
MPWQAKEAMYFSVAASTLVAEIVMQILSSYYMGYAANFAKQQRFFKSSTLDNVERGEDARVMYVGALLWLLVCVFAIIGCFWSIVGVNERISELGRQVGTSQHARRLRTQFVAAVTHWTLKRMHIRYCSRMSEASININTNYKPPTYSSWTRKPSRREIREMPAKKKAISESFARCSEGWNDLRDQLTTELDKLESLQTRERGLRDLLSKNESHSNSLDDILYVSVKRDLQLQEDIYWSLPKKWLEEAVHRLKELDGSCYMLQRRFQLHKKIITKVNKYREILQAGPPGESIETPYPTEMTTLLMFVEQDLPGITELEPLDQLKATQTEIQAPETETVSKSVLWYGRTNLNSLCVKEWAALERSWVELLLNGLDKRDAEKTESRRLRNFAAITVAGMFGCWVAQWVWWVGFIGTLGNS